MESSVQHGFGQRLVCARQCRTDLLPEAAPQPRHDLLHYNLGASLIYAARSDLHFMLEWIGN